MTINFQKLMLELSPSAVALMFESDWKMVMKTDHYIMDQKGMPILIEAEKTQQQVSYANKKSTPPQIEKIVSSCPSLFNNQPKMAAGVGGGGSKVVQCY